MPGHRGYIFSRSFAGQRVPQHVQNLVVRDYCQRNSYTYLLSATEYAMTGSYLMLESLLEDATLDGIVAYSYAQLPEVSTQSRSALERVVASDRSIHFAVENFTVRTQADIERLMTLLKIQRVLPACPKGIAA